MSLRLTSEVVCKTYLRMEDKFWSLKKVHIPHSDDAIRFVECCRVLVV